MLPDSVSEHCGQLVLRGARNVAISFCSLVTATLLSNAYAETYTQVSAGENHTCAVFGTGGVHCWGDNAWGRLGGGTTSTDSYAPVQALGITNAVAIAAGRRHTCAVAGGSVKCWGSNSAGQLG